jgi:hypothetical protein
MGEPKLGQVITDIGARRDAIHIAVAPMVATAALHPGQRLQNGIVDPFLTAPVQPGERYWLFLFPGTVTGMRHVWSHPAFTEDKA